MNDWPGIDEKELLRVSRDVAVFNAKPVNYTELARACKESAELSVEVWRVGLRVARQMLCRKALRRGGYVYFRNRRLA